MVTVILKILAWALALGWAVPAVVIVAAGLACATLARTPLAILWTLRWLLAFSLGYVAQIAGLVVVPVCAVLHLYQPGVSVRGKTILVWSIHWVELIYGNPEDGLDGGAPYQVILQTDGHYWDEPTRIIAWSAWRNKASGLRFLGSPFSFGILRAAIKGLGTDGNLYRPLTTFQKTEVQWSLAWQGSYAGLWIVDRGKQIRIGYDIVPDDARTPYDYSDLRQSYCAFSLQLNSN